MSYTPTTWSKGDVVTSAKLNKLEQGVAAADGIFYIDAQITGGTTPADMTLTSTTITADYLAALEAGKLLVLRVAMPAQAGGKPYLLTPLEVMVMYERASSMPGLSWSSPDLTVSNFSVEPGDNDTDPVIVKVQSVSYDVQGR